MLTKHENFQIKKSIMHVLDLGSNLITSDYELKLDEDDEFYKFIHRHTKRGITKVSRKSAKFTSPSMNVIRKYTDNVFNNNNRFVQETKKMARRLYDFMKVKTHVSADVIFLLCQKDDGNYFFAILVLEFTKQFFHSIKKDKKTGKKKITYNDNIFTLLGKSSSIKKCAFIRKYNKNDVYNIIVDESAKTTQYFFEYFLAAEFVIDDNEKTKIIYEIVSDYGYEINNHTIADKYLDAIEQFDSVSIYETILKNLQKKDVNQIIKRLESCGIIEDEININREYVDNYLKKVVIKLDNNTILHIPKAVKNNPEYFIMKNGIIELKNFKIIENNLKSK